MLLSQIWSWLISWLPCGKNDGWLFLLTMIRRSFSSITSTWLPKTMKYGKLLLSVLAAVFPPYNFAALRNHDRVGHTKYTLTKQ